MRCYECGTNLKTASTRGTNSDNETIRVKKCPNCKKIYYSKETIISEGKNNTNKINEQFKLKLAHIEAKDAVQEAWNILQDAIAMNGISINDVLIDTPEQMDVSDIDINRIKTLMGDN